MLAKNLIRVGTVSSVDPQNGTVRVTFPDKDDSVSHDLPVIVSPGSYALPGVGVNVVCLFLGNGMQAGFCLGTFYSAIQQPAATGEHLQGVWFEDGSHVYFDRSTGMLHLKAMGDVVIDGNLDVTGTLSRGGESI